MVNSSRFIRDDVKMIPIVVSIRHSLPCVELTAHAALEVISRNEMCSHRSCKTRRVSDTSFSAFSA